MISNSILIELLKIISKLDQKECKKLVEEVLQMNSSNDIENRMKKFIANLEL